MDCSDAAAAEEIIVCVFKVDPGPYFDSCVRDSCACDSGGDCECLCTAVAAYAKACNEAGACIKWRTPKFCRMCDYVPLASKTLWIRTRRESVVYRGKSPFRLYKL